MKAKKKYFILGFLIVLLISGYSVYKYVYKEHRNIATESINFKLNTVQLSMVMSTTQDAVKYIDKVVQTYGKVTSIEQNSVILDDSVQVNFSTESVNTLSLGIEVIIKGRCVGYDDLLELVKIDQATIINN